MFHMVISFMVRIFRLLSIADFAKSKFNNKKKTEINFCSAAVSPVLTMVQGFLALPIF